MINKFFKIRESVDIYTLPLKDKKYKIQFYRINTREKKSIEVDKIVLNILIFLDGSKTLKEIAKITNADIASIKKLINFLFQHGFLIEVQKDNVTEERFKRQISFFNDLIPNSNGEEVQKKLSSKKVVIFGVGSVGGDIAILLSRAGIKNFLLIDYKKTRKSDIVRHLYVNNKNLGIYKTDALKEYIQKINKKINVLCINKKLIPNSNLKEFIPEDTDIVINCADEPYIGHTSLKIGRYLWDKKIPLYIAGGFDAHSMSTGELIVPNKTPCIDCYQNSFRKALKDWKPSYNTEQEKKALIDFTEQHNDIENIIIGGAGSVAQCSLFSASYAVMKIIFHLIGLDITKESKRGEYLINEGIFTWVDFTKEECDICRRK